MGIFGGFEWILIVVVLFFLFGAKRIPRMAKSIGQAIREFRDARADEDEDDDEFRIDKQE